MALSPQEVVERFGYADGNECRYSPDGRHAADLDGWCFWCNKHVNDDEPLGDFDPERGDE
jgi:hypothetical protein